MRLVCIVLMALGTPAYAHHEAIVATSVIPALSGLALVVTVALGTWFNALKERATRRDLKHHRSDHHAGKRHG